jgi:uncharacterized protein YndB with AHSA1/START domain
MDCAIRASIRARPETIWALLTDAAAFPQWNSTVTRIEGRNAEGETLQVWVPSAPARVFKPKVSRLEASRSMIWSDGVAPMFKGVRTFTLTPNTDGTTDFSMREELSGLMLPLIKSSLPDFGPVFETYADDLKRAAPEPRSTRRTKTRARSLRRSSCRSVRPNFGITFARSKICTRC